MSGFVAGVDAVKIPRKGTSLSRPKPTKVRLVADALYWLSKNKDTRAARVPLEQVVRVMEGQNTKGFERFKSAFRDAKARSLSIVYNLDDEEHSLDLVLDSEQSFQSFKEDLRLHIAKASKRFGDPEAKLITRLWEKADVNLDNSLSRAEVVDLIKSMNINLDGSYIDKLYEEVDVNKDQTLDFEEFHLLIKKLRQRPELNSLWSALLRRDWAGLSASSSAALSTTLSLAEDQHKKVPLVDFHTFLTKVQGQVTATLEEARDIVKNFDPENNGDYISFPRFFNYLADNDNAALDPKKAVVYQDMSRPLNDYFIASSHNTYLEGDQLNSASSVNRYINDLVSGCRCVELDCWDGPDGEPIVYHGHTLTGRILFKDIITAVSQYAFQTSPYPVILSLENHCHIAQQKKMAGYLKSILGDTLAEPHVFAVKSPKQLPSPEDLKGKVIIKGKRLSATASSSNKTSSGDGEDDEEEEVEVDDDDEEDVGVEEGQASAEGAGSTTAAGPSQGQMGRSASVKGTVGGGKKSPPANAGKQKQRSPVSGAGVGNKSPVKALAEAIMGSSRALQKTKKKVKAPKVAQELSDITWMPGTHFKGWDGEQEPMNCTSYLENKMEKYVAKTPAEWVELNKRMFTRIYPAGLRVDSSNYNPVTPWTVGCQLVALNYQTPGLPMQLNKGKFSENGNSGYSLKPPAMRLPSLTFHPVNGPFPNPIDLEVRIISGQQLPKPKGATKGEVIDPYVKVEMFGVPADKKAATTRHVNDNGFNPVWDATFSFPIKAPELAMLHLAVWDKDNGPDDDFIASAAIPVTTLRSGFRKVPLSNFAGVKTQDFEYASLFLYIKIV